MWLLSVRHCRAAAGPWSSSRCVGSLTCCELRSGEAGLCGSPPARRRASAARAGPSAASEYMAASRRCPRSMRVGVRPEALPQRTPLQEPRTKPGRGFSPPSSRRASRRPPYEAGRVSKAAAPNCSNLQTEQGLAIRRCPKASPRHACGRGGRFDLASAATSRFLRRGGPPRAAKAHIQAALQTA